MKSIDKIGIFFYNGYMKILFICSSNVCRSPYCEFMFKELIKDNEVLLKEITSVRSAAVFNKSRKIHSKAQKSLMQEGISEDIILAHKPSFKWGSAFLFKEADIIIGMTKSHKLFLPFKYHKKFKTLSELAISKYVKIPDPFLKKTQEEYNEVMKIIKEYLVLYINKLTDAFSLN